jgi:TatD DNase family protein
MATGLPDCHAHLNTFPDTVQELMEEWEAAGVSRVLSVGMDAESSQEGVELAWRLRNIKACVGLHPWKVGEQFTDEAALEEYGDVASDPMVVAISEIGFDDQSIDTPLETQARVVKWFIGLGQERGFPVILHQRAPRQALLDVWDSLSGRPPAAALHSFRGDAEDLREFGARGFYFSLGPSSIGMIGDAIANEVVRAIPDDKLLVDSDAFPAGESWPEVHPAVVLQVADRVAAVRGVPVDELKARISENFTRLLRNQQ